MRGSLPYVLPLGSGRLGKLLAGIRLVAFDFDGVFTDNTVYVSQDGVESVRCWSSGGIGLTRSRSTGVHVLIISTEINSVVKVRANKLKVPFRQGIEDKADTILEICREKGVEPAQAAFVGNDINDVPDFKAVGFPVPVADAYPGIFSHVLYRTAKSGGQGAVCESCDLILQAKQSSLAGLEAYVP